MDSSVLVAVAVGLLVALILKKVLGRKTPPGPWGLPVVGYLPFLGIKETYIDFQRLAKKYGNIFSIRLGSQYVVLLNDYQSTKEAFAQDAFLGRPPESPFELNKETEETGAIFGLPWKEQRRFALHMLRDLGLGKTKMEGHMQEEITELLEHFEKHAGKPFIVRELLGSSMSNNISSLVFGKRYKYDDPIRIMLTNTINTTSREGGAVMWQLFFPWLRKICKFLHVGDVDKMSRLSQKLKSHSQEVIEEHERTLNPGIIRDFIDAYLLEIEKRTDDPAFNKGTLQDLIGAFFGGGSETVRVTCEWLLLVAASNKEYQQRIHAEIDEVVGRERLPTGPDKKDMPFTDAFILELWRWRTILPINLMRHTLTDVELGGYFIPKHSKVLSNIWAVHHDPEYWGRDVEEFRPERFLSDDGKTVKKFERFMPFSVGKRQCPGEPLARVEVFLYFAAILQKFDLRLPDGKVADFEPVLGLSLSPKPQELIFTIRQ